MSDRQENLFVSLLDYHLERIPEAERAGIEGLVRNDPAARQASERLGRVLDPLDAWTVPPVSSLLPDKIIARVAAVRREERLAEARRVVHLLEPVEAGDRPSPARWLFSLKEVMALAACILLLFSVLVPGVAQVRRDSQRALCASRLGDVYRGLGLYREMDREALPFAGGIGATAWLPSANSSATPYRSNSRHVYLTLKYRLVKGPESFVCPASPVGRPMNPSFLPESDDFHSSNNITFDTLNLSGDNPPVRPSRAIAYMSDRSPLFLDGRFHADVDPSLTNSPTHDGGAGQNVLKLDGSVDWFTTPYYGPRGDNLWTRSDVDEYSGIESSADPDDSFIIPGFPGRGGTSTEFAH
jgi:hypothetical protein